MISGIYIFVKWFFTHTNFLFLKIIFWYYINVLILYPSLVLAVCAFITFMGTPASKIRFIACYFVLVLWSSIVGLIIWPIYVIKGKNIRNTLYGAVVIGPLAKVLGMEFELRNGQFLSSNTGAAIVVANHQSFFDIIGMFTIWHVMQRCTVIARKKVFWAWPFGLVAWLAGVVFIDRIPSCSKTHEKFNKAADYIHKERAKLWIFVEGTRNPNPRKLLPFKKGAFRVAISRQLPIIPVVYSPYYFIDGKLLYFGRGRITMEVLEPISTEGLKLENMDKLMTKTYRLMSNKNDEFWSLKQKQK